MERQPPYGAGNIAPGIPAITAGHSLLSASQSSPPSACLTVGLPLDEATELGFHVPHS